MSFNRAGKSKQTATSLNKYFAREKESHTKGSFYIEPIQRSIAGAYTSSWGHPDQRRKNAEDHIGSRCFLSLIWTAYPQRNPRIIQYSLKYQQGIAVCSAGRRGEGGALESPNLGVNRFNSELR
jgi:hypothetical protein